MVANMYITIYCLRKKKDPGDKGDQISDSPVY